MYYQYSDKEKSNLKSWLIEAFDRLILKDSAILNPKIIPTKFRIDGQKDLNREVHETAINHRIATHLEYFAEKFGIIDYHFDIDYNRYINQRKRVISIVTNELIEVRPDIIVHKRTRLSDPLPHLLVVEAKKYSLIEKDRNHVKDLMNDRNYQYKFGLLVSYYKNPKTIEIELLTYENGQFQSEVFSVSK
jgi:hypothetical protein